MKIKNEYIEIKIGDKKFTKNNMILDTYLNKIFNSQIHAEHDESLLSYCYIKFDEPIDNINYESDIDPKDYFDIILISIKNYYPVIKTSNNTIRLIYKFNTQSFMYHNGNSWVGQGGSNFNIFIGKKITALGFGSYNNLYAFLDTRNMNMIINQSENIQITRADLIQSDGIVKDYDYPLHLVQDVLNRTAVGREDKKYAQLYSIGFGNVAGLMEEEYLIYDVVTDGDNNSITFTLNRNKKIGHYPSDNLQLGFYPTKDNSKYLILKYRLYKKELDSSSNNYIINYLDKYYTMNMKNENFGKLQIKLKIERM